MFENIWKLSTRKQHIFSILATFVIMSITTCIAFVYYDIVPEHSANIALVYILALVLVSRFTAVDIACIPQDSRAAAVGTADGLFLHFVITPL